MDNKNGSFDFLSETEAKKAVENEMNVFAVGQIHQVNGSRLRVESIKKKKITFKLLSPLNNEE